MAGTATKVATKVKVGLLKRFGKISTSPTIVFVIFYQSRYKDKGLNPTIFTSGFIQEQEFHLVSQLGLDFISL